MNLLVDNDVIHKLAAFDLLPAAIDCLCGKASRSFVSPRTPFSMCVRKNQHKGQNKYGAETHARIASFVESALILQSQADPQDLAVLADVLGIDEGEALLFAAAANDPEACVATGDHRSIDSLVGAKTCSSLLDRLQGRIVIVEHFVLAAIRDLGFATVKARLLPGVTIDTGIHSWAFGSGADADQHIAVAGLQRRILKLRDRAGPMICPPPS